jgi:hypothetical protein
VNFPCAGKYPFRMAALNDCVKYFIETIGSSLTILSVMRS